MWPTSLLVAISRSHLGSNLGAFGLRQVCLSRMTTGLPRPLAGAPIPSAPWDAALATDSLVRPGGAAERRP
eukprot:8366112-Pyramimonas_sp.AAC.1